MLLELRPEASVRLERVVIAERKLASVERYVVAADGQAKLAQWTTVFCYDSMDLADEVVV